MSSPAPDILTTSLIPDTALALDVGTPLKRMRSVYLGTLDATVALGYTKGGAVTQLTDKTTTVVLNAPAGEITLVNTALNAATIVSFTLTNSSLGATDVLVLNHVAVGTFGAYTLNAHSFAAGSCIIDLRNNTAGALSEAIVIRFAIIKAANS